MILMLLHAQGGGFGGPFGGGGLSGSASNGKNQMIKSKRINGQR